MATRYVFKFWGSIGPAGSLVGLTEKLCTSIYYHAYNYGDPADLETQIDRDLRKVREDYIQELFQFKNKFAKKTGEGASEAEKDEAFKKLITIIKSYIDKTKRLEKNKYMRERIFYQREGQIQLYEEANRKYHTCEDEITDNLVRQAKTIYAPSSEDFQRYFQEFNVDDDQNQREIKDQIPELQAKEYLNTWIRIQNDHQTEVNRLKRIQDDPNNTPEDQEKINTILNFSADEETQYLKDLLFIETGEDVEDIFYAFKAHKLQ